MYPYSYSKSRNTNSKQNQEQNTSHLLNIAAPDVIETLVQIEDVTVCQVASGNVSVAQEKEEETRL